MRDSSKDSRRSLRPTTQHQELENLFQQFRTLQIGPDDSPLSQLVASIDACHNRSNLPEVSGLDLSPLPDNNFDLSAVNQSDWLSAPPFWSLSPELADILTAASKETPETETTSDAPSQENLANETNLSDFVPRVYIHLTPRRQNGELHLTSHFSSPLSPLTPSGESSSSTSSPSPSSSDSTFLSLSYLLDPSGLSFRTNLGSQENPLALAQPSSAATLHLGPTFTPSNIIIPPSAQPTM